MDGFSDRLSQRFASPQDMINANSMAEATQTERLQNEIRGLVRTIEMLEDRINTLQSSGVGAVDLTGVTEQLKSTTEELEAHIHKENVKVYRNVQASMNDELGKQAEAVGEQLATNNQLIFEELKNKTDMLGAMMNVLNEQQKSQGAAVSGMAAQLNAMETSLTKSLKIRAVLPIQIIMLVIVLGDLAINILITLGFIQGF